MLRLVASPEAAFEGTAVQTRASEASGAGGL